MVRPKRRSIKPPRKYTSEASKSARPRRSTRQTRASLQTSKLELETTNAESYASKESGEESESKVSLPSEEIPANTEACEGTSLPPKEADASGGTAQQQHHQGTGAEFSETSSASTGQVSELAGLRAMPEFFKQDEDGDTYLHIAVVQGNQRLVSFLMNAMRHVTLDIYNKLRQTPLHLAVITKQAGLVRSLIEAGADVNLMDRHGKTALHLACELGDVQCVTAIRHATSQNKERIALDTTNAQGLSAIHVATLTCDRELIAELLEMGASINAKDANSGRTSLHHAVESGRRHVIEFLLSRGAHVNERTFSGNTPLHTAAGRYMDDIVALLTKYGADVNIANREGDTPKVVRGDSALVKRQLEASRQAPKRQKISKRPAQNPQSKAKGKT